MSEALLQQMDTRFMKSRVPQVRVGYSLRVTQTIQEGSKTRKQMFQGLVISLNRKKGISHTFTVRKVFDGIGVEKVFPLHSPGIEIEIIKIAKVRRSKMYYMRERFGKSARLNEKMTTQAERDALMMEAFVEEKEAKEEPEMIKKEEPIENSDTKSEEKKEISLEKESAKDDANTSKKENE